jgi:anaerobic sulfite reductase subunit C
MNWNQDALEAISKAPALLRPMIRRRVESHVADHGASVVTLEDVDEVRRSRGPKSAQAEAPEGREQVADVGIDPADIEKVIAATPQSAVVSDSRFYEVKVCGGAFGCPRTLFDVTVLAKAIIAGIEDSGLTDVVAARVSGPVLRHHKFSVAISGCANSCSQPQINDFGVQGRARVNLGSGPCIDCRECVRVCGEGSMKVDDAVPEIDRSKCINCGDCAVVCPTEALVMEERGYSVLAGGKLGRHPQLARELFEFTDEARLMAALDVSVEVFKNEMLSGERLADAVTRIGVETLKERIVARMK